MTENRNIDQKLLASFIEYAAENKVTSKEWNRFVLQHYLDSKLEKARSECARLLCGYGETPPNSRETKSILYKIARELREST